ncbi:MAG TPA: carbohydrate ABC transporter permease [Baekduia sp.]|uniref:carbohydrate ABC transporter permease n=1 Tax=Baekduia sp. TaxID=2600305 RepID=UPI002D76A239|nr:carbohydrate ABC transporter permease [Baekduia sp.]HET6507094.1 carbohydrate ABC transporter permease [Baekduia sp.]
MRLTRNEVAMNYAVLGFFALLTIFPLIGLVSSALGDPSSSTPQFGFGDGIHLSNFSDAWKEGHFSTYLVSSVIVSTSATVLCCFVSILSGYAFATMEFRGRTVLFALLVMGIVVPSEAVVVPQYFELRDLGLTDTYLSLILPQTAGILAFGTFWMRNFFRSVPRALVDAAAVDGANSWQTLWRVLMPIGKPALLTMATLAFMWTWNEFLLALVMITKESVRTAPLGLSFFRGAHLTEYSLLSAAALIVAAPVVALYFFFQRHFIAGMLSGALKE